MRNPTSYRHYRRAFARAHGYIWRELSERSKPPPRDMQHIVHVPHCGMPHEKIARPKRAPVSVGFVTMPVAR